MNLILLLVVLLPIAGGLAMFRFPAPDRKRRNAYVLGLCGTVSVLVLLSVAWRLHSKDAMEFVLLHILRDRMVLALRMDGLSVVFAAIVAVLWPVTDLYAFEYMSHEHGENRFFAFFTMTYGVVLGIALSANLFTLYFFYELLTLCTLPLVMHEMDGKARFAGKKYLTYSMTGAAMAFISMMLLMEQGSLDFVLGGSLGGADSDYLRAAFLLGFFGFGVKAAVFPFHGWLPSAGVAPTPVTALLHAVAVVNAGLFAVLRLLYYGYGPQLLSGSWAQDVMLGFTAFTIVYGSAMAWRMQHLKRRLAYSTVSNLSYVLLAAALCSGEGLAAALTHMAAHSVLKITLFFCAGALLTQTEEMPGGVREYVFQYNGFARKMPVVFCVFTFASLGLIGVPPFVGFTSKWAIARSAAAAGVPFGYIGCAALVLSAFLTGMYQLDVVIRGYFPPEGFDKAPLAHVKDPGKEMKTAMAILVVLTVLMSLWWAAPLTEIFAGIASGTV